MSHNQRLITGREDNNYAQKYWLRLRLCWTFTIYDWNRKGTALNAQMRVWLARNWRRLGLEVLLDCWWRGRGFCWMSENDRSVGIEWKLANGYIAMQGHWSTYLWTFLAHRSWCSATPDAVRPMISHCRCYCCWWRWCVAMAWCNDRSFDVDSAFAASGWCSSSTTKWIAVAAEYCDRPYGICFDWDHTGLWPLLWLVTIDWGSDSFRCEIAANSLERCAWNESN